MEPSSGPAAGVSTTLADWFATPLGRYLLAREQAYFDQTVADIFGFHALQVGLPDCPFLAQSRIPSRWTIDYDPPADVIADPHGLPFAENAVDLIVMPHALEFTDDPHLMLREAYRVIRPEGQIVISGFNPFSLYGAKRYFGRGSHAAVERQLHRALPAEGLADAARLRRRRGPPRRLCAALRAREVAAALRLLRGDGRSLVADRGRRLLPARDQESARHARDHARLATARAAEGAGAGSARARGPDHVRSIAAVSAGRSVLPARRRARPGCAATRVTRTAASLERGRHLHGRRLQGQPRSRRLGRGAARGRAREGDLRRRAPHDQQPDGTDRGDPRAGVAQAADAGRGLHRLAVREERHRDVDPRLEAQRLEDRRQEAGEERRTLARARGAGAAPRRVVALGEGSRRQ